MKFGSFTNVFNKSDKNPKDHEENIIDSFPDEVKKKLVEPKEAFNAIESGDRVFIGTACATPQKFLAEFEKHGLGKSDIQMIHFLTDGSINIEEGKPKTRFQHKVFFVGNDTRLAIKEGMADYIPISLASVPDLFKTGRIPLDVAIIQVSLPDKHGFVSLGISVDITMAAVFSAKIVIAEINPNMPKTLGNSFVPISKIDFFTLVETPVLEYLHEPSDEIADKIARYAARIIQDNSTLQIGLGRIPNEMLKYLSNRKNLGIHSDVITDAVLDLVDKGVITGNAKTSHKGKIVTSYCMGTSKLYKKVHRNPLFAFHPIEYICDPVEIKKNYRMVSVTQAFTIDLTGQVCSDQFEGEFYGGVSTQPEFVQGTAAAPGGKPIICLPSTTDDGKKSRIRPLLLEGEGVTIARSDIHYVITEYGSAYLFAKSIKERALALIEIAHPDFREDLLIQAKKLGYVRENQALKSKTGYPEKEEREIVLKNGEEIIIRPSKASDFQGLQDIFYNLRPEDILTRFFTQLSSLSVTQAQHLCNVDYDNEMAFIALQGTMEHEKIIGSSCYFKDQSDNLGEVAYMILPEWQSKGVGTQLQKRMQDYAKAKGIKGFKADILAENTKMNRLFQQGKDIVVKQNGDAYEVEMLF